MRAAVPVLCVQDLQAALLFYTRLGFQVQATYPDYALLACGEAQLHLRVPHAEEHVSAEQNPCGAYLFVDGLHAWVEQWESAGVRLLSQPREQPYGVRECALSDPDGNMLRVGERLRGEGQP